ncbi:MAG: hypothetical protein ACRENK_04580, partial [Gemmatimonadaceae bacterium]
MVNSRTLSRGDSSSGQDGDGGAQQAASDFLESEYETAIDLLKYYDDRHYDLLKFASALAAGVPTLIFGFYGLSNQAAAAVWDFATFIVAVTAIGLVCVLAAMVRNRVYFVFPARQANVLRSRLFSDAVSALKPRTPAVQNQLYTTGDIPMFDWNSTQGIQIVFVALQCALFAGASVYSFRRSTIDVKALWVETVVT